MNLGSRRGVARRAYAVAIVVGALLSTLPPPARAVQSPQQVVVNANPADWTPDILDGQVNAILQVGTRIVVGGSFTQVRRHGFAQIFTRNNIFAFEMNTGIIDQNFIPQVPGTVEALALGPDG